MDLRRVIWDTILPRVKKPSRYTGNELNAIHKDPRSVAARILLAFPDLYETGMSHLGLKILYDLINKRGDSLAERVYAPDVDLEALLRVEGLPLFSLESTAPGGSFDIIGFTLQYELSYPTILNMLDLMAVPLASRDRGAGDSLVLAGGPCAFNPEPLAEFVDAFVIGDGEEAIGDVIDAYLECKRRALPRADLLRRLAGIEGVYVPSLVDVKYRQDGRIERFLPEAGVQFPVRKRVVKDLETTSYPTAFIVPFGEIVHDRAMVEVFRGCTRGCRFCQAGMIYRPVRERSKETVAKLAEEVLDRTGWEEISLTSLSTGDYSCIEPLVDNLMRVQGPRGVALSLPSLRVDSFSVQLAERIQAVRKTGLTFAPEAGTQRLRDVINKNVTEENLLTACEGAFRAGWDAIKLYFMIGLPTETDEDLLGIVDLANKVAKLGRDIKKPRGSAHRVRVTVSASSFVPKGHTPFQWEAQVSREELARRQRILMDRLTDRAISFQWHEVQPSFLEAVLARGDRRIGRVLARVVELGARLDAWSDHFSFERWERALEEADIDPKWYANRERASDEIFPWEVVDAGVTREFLAAEHERALAGESTADCRSEACSNCGVCVRLKVKPIQFGRVAAVRAEEAR